MDVRKMRVDELELLSFTDIAYYIIKKDKESKTTVQLFKEICFLLKLSDNQFEEKIADFFTTLTTDKRFILLNSSNWDLKENYSSSLPLDNDEDGDDLDDYILADEMDNAYDNEEDEDDEDDEGEEDLKDLTLIDDEEE